MRRFSDSRCTRCCSGRNVVLLPHLAEGPDADRQPALGHQPIMPRGPASGHRTGRVARPGWRPRHSSSARRPGCSRAHDYRHLSGFMEFRMVYRLLVNHHKIRIDCRRGPDSQPLRAGRRHAAPGAGRPPRGTGGDAHHAGADSERPVRQGRHAGRAAGRRQDRVAGPDAGSGRGARHDRIAGRGAGRTLPAVHPGARASFGAAQAVPPEGGAAAGTTRPAGAGQLRLSVEGEVPGPGGRPGP